MIMNLLLCWLILFAQPQQTAGYTALVNSSKGTFTIPVKQRSRWAWRLADTPDNQMEYRMDVTVKNEGIEYTFGFYLWKRHGTSAGSGTLNDLISTGQRSLFERGRPGLMSRVHDAEIEVKSKGDVIVILLGKKDLKRLFSSKPAEVVFKIKIPGESDISQTVPVVYQ